MESCALPKLGLAPNRAAALLDNAEHRGQAQAGPFATVLSSKKRLENLGLSLLIHTNAAVADIHLDIVAGLEIPDLSLGRIQLRVGGVDRELPAGGHGISRAQGEVHQHTSDFPGVGSHPPQLGIE